MIFFQLISHSKVPKIGITPPSPTPTIPGKHNFPSDPPPLRKKLFGSAHENVAHRWKWGGSIHHYLLTSSRALGSEMLQQNIRKRCCLHGSFWGFFFYTLLQSISNFNGFCSTSHAMVPHVIFVFVLKIQKPVFVWCLHEKFMQS